MLITFDFSNWLASFSQPRKQVAEIVTNACTLYEIKIVFNLFLRSTVPRMLQINCMAMFIGFLNLNFEMEFHLNSSLICVLFMLFPLHSIMDSLSFESELLWPKVTNQFWNACCLL